MIGIEKNFKSWEIKLIMVIGFGEKPCVCLFFPFVFRMTE